MTRCRYKKLLPEDRKRILELRQEGKTKRQIAEIMNRPASTIQGIICKPKPTIDPVIDFGDKNGFFDLNKYKRALNY